MKRGRRAAYRAVCLGLPCVILIGLFAFPGGAGQGPDHIHIVVGGTAAERATALARHFLHEQEGIDDAESPLAPRAVRSRGVRVFSMRRNRDGGPAVLSVQRGGAVLLAAGLPVSIPLQISRVAACPPLRAPRTVLSTPDPPPRRA